MISEEQRQEIIDRLKEKFEKGWMREVGIPDGWIEIAGTLDESISELYPDYKIHQIKTKFGHLRYYCTNEDDHAVWDLIMSAERQARITCMACGEPGEGRDHFWVGCDEHKTHPNRFIFKKEGISGP